MRIELLIYCHNFQRRLSWVLSSLTQQTADMGDVGVNIACQHRNGDPCTEELVSTFHNIDIKLTYVQDVDTFAKPSLTKNIQIQNSKAEWIMCHSADHVFPKNYFETLYKILDNRKDHKNCLGCGSKVHTDRYATDDAVNALYGQAIPEVYQRASRLPVSGRESARRHGGHILFRRAAVMANTGGFYAKQCRDKHLFRDGMKTRSDPGFRKLMGGTEVVTLPRLIHLNHQRDKELGYHSEEQR